MDDGVVMEHIEALVAEEHQLQAAAGEGHALAPDERLRMDAIRVQLDRYWDLLRQRRAHEEFGLGTDDTSLRSGTTVARYQQ